MAAIFPLLLSSADAHRAPVWTIARPLASSSRRVGATWAADVRWNGAAKCALDIALHDLAGKVLGIPVHELIGLPAEIPPTDFTIGIDEPAIVAERAARAADFPALKIKCGGPQDLETLRAVREVFSRPDPRRRQHRLDARRRRAPAARRSSTSASSSSSSRSRPAPIATSRWLQERSSIPIVADESAVTEEDLDALVGVVAGVNVKLAKCGGIGPAKAMLERARELGFRTFLGCMEETSVGIAGSAAVASLADWVDLDGCLLLADDPFEGLELDADHRWILTSRPGLGLTLRTA